MKRINSSRNRLTLSLFFQFWVTILIYSLAMFMLFVAVAFFSRFIDFGNWIYRIGLNSPILAAVAWVTGAVVILLLFFRKSSGYVDQVTAAVDHLFQRDVDLIKLPPELHHIEEKLNLLKYEMSRSQLMAKEAEQRKNELIVYLAHDLKTPLTSVIGYLSLLREEQEVSQEVRNKYLSTAADKAARLEDLINDFFEVTRFNVYSQELHPSSLNLTRMLEQMTDEFKPLLKDKNLTLLLQAAPDISLTGDVKKLERAFDNLIRNAIDYSYSDSEIQIIVMPGVDMVSITFRNAGDDIPKNQLARIFEQFFRADPARTTDKGGSGLGLAITKQIVELHGGTIAASSENNVIEVRLSLPVRKP